MTVVDRYQVFNGSLTQLEMHAAFPSAYTKVVKAADYDALAAELSHYKANHRSADALEEEFERKDARIAALEAELATEKEFRRLEHEVSVSNSERREILNIVHGALTPSDAAKKHG
jgi:hypothetical protein